ncbi:unnamed protein product, partial [Meganyctiphanes norvegica]
SKYQGNHNYGFTYNIGVGGPGSPRYGHHEIRNDHQTQGYYEVQLPSHSNQKVSYTISESSSAAAPTSTYKEITNENTSSPHLFNKRQKNNKHRSKENNKVLKKRLIAYENSNAQSNIKQATRPPRAPATFFNFGRNGFQENNILGKSISTSTSSVSSTVSVGSAVSQTSTPSQFSDSNKQPIHSTPRTFTNRKHILQTIGNVNTGSQSHTVLLNNKPALLVPSRPLPKKSKRFGSIETSVSRQSPVNSQPSFQPSFINTHKGNVPHSQRVASSQQLILPQQLINPILSHINSQLALNFHSRPIIKLPQQVIRNTAPNQITNRSEKINSITTTPDGRLSLLVPSRPYISNQKSSTSLSIQKATPIKFSIPSSTGATDIRTMSDMRNRLNQVLLELFSNTPRNQEPKNILPIQTTNPPIEANTVQPGTSLFFKKSNFVKPHESKFLTFQKNIPRKKLSKSLFKEQQAKLFFNKISKYNKNQGTIVTKSPIVRSFTVQADLKDHKRMTRGGRNFGSPEILEKLGFTGLSQLAKKGKVTPIRAVPFATFHL